jgi:hypothetical protein
MAEKREKKAFQREIIDLIQNKKGFCKGVFMPEEILHFCSEDKDIALMLSQLIYWTGRGSNREGFVWKSFRECKKETGLSQYQARKASKWLQSKGLLEVKKKMAMGHPTNYYRLNQKKVFDSISKFLTMKSEISNNGIGKNLSIYNIDNNTQSTTKKDTNIEFYQNSAQGISFDSFLSEMSERGDEVDAEAIVAISYFLQKYESLRNKRHPLLSFSKWSGLVDTMLHCTGHYEEFFELSSDDLEKMIDRYFVTGFSVDCNYMIMHFNSEGIKGRLYYETVYRD